MGANSKFLIHNGVVSSPSDTPSLSTFLASHPGAYTTTRTHNNGKLILFWERHLHRLANSARILFNTNPKLLFEARDHTDLFSIPLIQSLRWELVIQTLVDDSIRKVLPMALKERKNGEELSITSLLSGNWEKMRGIGSIDEESVGRIFNVYVHVGIYVPPVFGIRENGANLAVMGRRRDVAEAKYSDWVRLRKPLESLKPPSATELLLSNNGDRILEGCVTNFFVVCRKGKDICDGMYPFEIQTAPVGDGVLPGVIRQVIIEICSRNGIPLREVAPSWSHHEMWEEAFITSKPYGGGRLSRQASEIGLLASGVYNTLYRRVDPLGSLRLLQHVKTIQVPTSWKSLQSRSFENLMWAEKRFEESPGRITAAIQKEIMKELGSEGYPVATI